MHLLEGLLEAILVGAGGTLLLYVVLWAIIFLVQGN